MTIQEKVAQTFKAFGDNVAIECEGKQITYHQLRNNANRITGEILNRGAGPGTIIGICLTHVEEIIPAIIGVMNARCVFVMIDNSLPESVLRSMIGNLALEYIITSVGGKTKVDSLKKDLHEIIYEKEWSTAADSSEIVYPEFDERDSVYVYFTSGSSGVPKGVIGVNAGLTHFLQWELDAIKPDATFRCSQFVSPYFDAFLRDIFLPILAGGTICIPPGGRQFFEATEMIRWIDETCINLIHCVPGVFRLFNTDLLTPEHFKHLKFILMSGEKIVPAELENWYSRFGSRIQLVNLYGSTEATMVQSCYFVQPEDAGKTSISIGDPIRDIAFVISNTDLKPCGPLVTGDLYVISNFMTRGYINNPELTGEKFLPIDIAGGARIAYKTGDKARVLTDGKIELLGREDRQVKLRGIRIELDEIENVLFRSPLVKSAYVIKNQELNSDDSLTAFIILDQRWEDYDGWSTDIQHYVDDQLPDYMIPSKFVALKEFPILSNGKIDHKKLLQIDLVNHNILAPGNEIEAGILAIWKDILGDKPISVEDSFHTVGGNSLSIMKLIGRIYKKYNVRITLSDLFNNLTVRKQAAIIQKCSNDYLYLILKVEKKPSYHVSSVQAMMYYDDSSGKKGISSNQPIAWEVKGEFDVKKMERLLRQLIARYEALRTDFKFENGELKQVVHDTVDFYLEETAIPDEAIHEAVADYVRPFDLSTAPLMRAGLVTTSGGKRVLVIDLHHIICDEMSQAILFSDLLKLYNDDELAPVAIQFKDYAEWEWSFRSSGEYLSHRESWLKQFEDEIPRIELPVIYPGTQITSDKGGNIYFNLDKEDISFFVNYLQDNGLTPFSGLFCLYFLFLCQLTGQEDLVIGVVTSGRMQEELKNVVGMFEKTLPIRYKLNPEILPGDLLKDIGDYLTRAQNRQIYDLSNIMIDLNSTRDDIRKPLFDVLFDFQDADSGRFEKPGHHIYRDDNGPSKYPLSLFVIDNGISFAFRMEYRNAYFTKTDAEMLADQLKKLIVSVSKNPETKVIDLIGLTQEASGLAAEDDLSFNF
jgi:mycobactin peptide synthetase MbtE